MKQTEQILQGFRLINTQELPDIQSKAWHMEHIKTGARLLYLENEDVNKTFAITFKTLPEDETGLAHILEHSVLSGSRKYPVKSPFLEMRKSSLSTFLNAMTFNDKTMYPVSSKNDADFTNLMDTYLDAVFNPLVYERKEIFLQEGWRYEKQPEGEDYFYNGIVFNEMKGAYSSPDRVLINAIKQSLYPDTPYGLDSGGNPEAIINLQYEDFLTYHRSLYHPSNSYIFLYGKMNLEEKLAMLDQEYLSGFARQEAPGPVKLQPAFPEVTTLEANYAIAAGQSPEGKTFIARNFVLGSLLDKEKVLSYMILERVLFDPNGSELKRRLQEADIAEEFEGFYYPIGIQPFFTFLARNSNPEHGETFYRIIREYLEELEKDGIPEELLMGAINSLEFKLRENTSSANRGIGYSQSVMNSWLHGDDPCKYLEFSTTMEMVRLKKEEGHFEKLIRESFLDNTHASQVLLHPQPGLGEDFQEKLENTLRERMALLTPSQWALMQEEQELLEKYQKEGDSQENLERLPMLSVKDLERNQEETPTEHLVAGEIAYILHPMFSNRIVYLDLYFDTNRIPQNKIIWLHLLGDLLGSMSTGKHHYQKLVNRINLYTGGVDFSLQCLSLYRSGGIRPMLRVSGKCFLENTETLLEIMLEILGDTRFTHSERLEDMLTELKSLKESELLEDSMSVAQMRLSSYFTQSGMYQEEGNLPYFEMLRDLCENFQERLPEIQGNLQQVLELIGGKNLLTCSIITDPDSITEVRNRIHDRLEALPQVSATPVVYNFSPENRREGIAIPAKVQYVIQGGNFRKEGNNPYTGALRVVAKILNTDYLWQKLRVQGGAYGGFVSISLFGNLMFSSYRDPHLEVTLENYRKAPAYLETLELSGRDLDRYIIGTIGDFDAPMNVSARGKAANTYYFQEITHQDLQKIREEILDTRVEDIRSFAPAVASVLAQECYCVIGSEERLEQNQQLFKKLIKFF